MNGDEKIVTFEGWRHFDEIREVDMECCIENVNDVIKDDEVTKQKVRQEISTNRNPHYCNTRHNKDKQQISQFKAN